MNRVEAVALIILGFAVGFGWYKLWVEPEDARRFEIMHCMDGDRSRAAYDACVARLGDR